jgi:hypothetical protein
LNPFLQLAAEKKDSKNGAARNFFVPSYSDPTLEFCKGQLNSEWIYEVIVSPKILVGILVETMTS